VTDPRDDLRRLQPYLGEIHEAALAHGEDTALLAALCLRETLAGWAAGYKPKGDANGRGDGGHGRGLFQIDDRGPYKDLVPAPGVDWSPFQQAQAACIVLADAREQLAEFRALPVFEVATICRYNASLARVVAALRVGVHPDTVTTKGPSGRPDYGSDVLARRALLRAKYPTVFPPVTGSPLG
jgi:hypothetical protein